MGITEGRGVRTGKGGRERPPPPWGRGKGWMKEPRLTCLYGLIPYEYGGRIIENREWEKAPAAINRVKKRIERFLNFEFDTLLLNRYRNEKDTVGWHSDNERIFGDFSIIASLTLLENKGRGGLRSMEFKMKKKKHTLDYLVTVHICMVVFS